MRASPWVALVLVTTSCGHNQPRTGGPERDDVQDGATLLVPDEASKRVAHQGTLAPADGDLDDWFTVVFPEGGPVRFTAALEVDGAHLPAKLEVVDENGVILWRFGERRRGAAQSIARLNDVYGPARIYIRIGDDADAPRVRYRLSFEDLGRIAPPEPPRCDPRKWDINNPNCEGVCNLSAPDLRRAECCIVMQPCVRTPRGRGQIWADCVSPVVRFDGDRIVAAAGSDHARLQGLDAHLETDVPEPDPPGLTERDRLSRERRLARNFDDPPQLTLEELRPEESVWRLSYPEDHDLTWLVAHARAVVVRPPHVCRRPYLGRP